MSNSALVLDVTFHKDEGRLLWIVLDGNRVCGGAWLDYTDEGAGIDAAIIAAKKEIATLPEKPEVRTYWGLSKAFRR